MPPSRRRRRGSARTNTSALDRQGEISDQRRWENELDERWDARFNELLKYKAKHGDCNIPLRQGLLGSWVSIQRREYKNGKISQDRIDRLDGIGFKWKLKNGGKNVPWETRFNELLKYRAKRGNCDVSLMDGGRLGVWVSNQRVNYKADTLSQDRIDQLNSIGFKWALKEGGKIVPWETRFDELIEYKAKHSDCNVPVRQGQLRQWVSFQRRLYLADSLAQDRIDRLDGIGFHWTSPGRGSAARKTTIGARRQSSRSKTRTKFQSGSAEAELLGSKTETVKDEGCDPGTITEGNDEDDEEVGAMIYEEAMRRRQALTRRRTRSSMKYY